MRMFKNIRPWLVLVIPPVLFWIAIVLLSFFYTLMGATSSGEVMLRITSNIPLLLFVSQLLLLALLFIVLRKEGQTFFTLGWTSDADKKLWREILLGSALGVTLGILYVCALSPLHEYMQLAFGDYVPAGKVLSSLGGSALLFFSANVLLAPFIEERLYRGYALMRLQERYGQTIAVIITSIFFGLFHWSGGLWYMLLTGAVVGTLFGVIAVKRKSIVLTFFAHLSLNLVEFIFVFSR